MPNSTRKNFRGHIEELARRLKVVLFTLIASTVVILVLPGNLNFLQNFEYYEPWVSIFLKTIRERVLPSNVNLIAIHFTDPIELYVFASLIFSLTITLPVLAYEVYRFIDPALHPHERKEIYPFVASVAILFIFGILFGFFILFPFFIMSMFPFFTAVGAELIFSLMDFYNTLFFTVIVTGLVFASPAFFVILVKYGIIRTDMFRQKRKYLYLALVGLAMIISPGASPQGNLFLFVPMAVLFEAGLFFGRRYEKKGKVRPLNWFSNPRCKFCNADLSDNSSFCPKCKRSQA